MSGLILLTAKYSVAFTSSHNPTQSVHIQYSQLGVLSDDSNRFRRPAGQNTHKTCHLKRNTLVPGLMRI